MGRIRRIHQLRPIELWLECVQAVQKIRRINVIEVRRCLCAQALGRFAEGINRVAEVGLFGSHIDLFTRRIGHAIDGAEDAGFPGHADIEGKAARRRGPLMGGAQVGLPKPGKRLVPRVLATDSPGVGTALSAVTRRETDNSR